MLRGMVALHCTRKLARLLNCHPMRDPQPPTNALGNWYGNVVDTSGGQLAVFINERSLLTVAVPTQQGHDVLAMFFQRVANLLSMLDVANYLIERELAEMQTLQLATTSNRRVLGALNESAYQLQAMVDSVAPDTKLSLSDAELELSDFPHGALRCTSPAKLARELLTSTGMWRDT